ncbi:MAG: alpha/beta fold hydrolase [Pseudomonadota bacterium]|nr:alpha/beta fold hydrolase [Pseudomonadota bacterium]
MNLASRELGDGEPIVILHGLFGSNRNWMSIARKLSATNRVLALDLPNHGESSWSDSMSYDFLSEIISNFIVEHDLKGATVLGHSMGGKIAMTLALTEPELIDRLIIADIAPVNYTHDNLSIITALESLDLALVKNRGDADIELREKIPDREMRAFLLQNLVYNDKRYEWRINMPVIKAYLADLEGFPSFSEQVFFEGPTLFLSGVDSDFIEPDHHKIISRLFPESSIVNIENAGHWLHVDNSKSFLQCVLRFIEP